MRYLPDVAELVSLALIAWGMSQLHGWPMSSLVCGCLVFGVCLAGRLRAR